MIRTSRRKHTTGLLASFVSVAALFASVDSASGQTADAIVEIPPVALGDVPELGNHDLPQGVVRALAIRLPANLFETPPALDTPAQVVRIPTGVDSSVELIEERRVVRNGRTLIYGRDRTQDHASFMFVREDGRVWRGEIRRQDELITLTGPRIVGGDVQFRLLVWRPSAIPEEREPKEAKPATGRDESPGINGNLDGDIDAVGLPPEMADPVVVRVLVVYTQAAAEKAESVMGESIVATIDGVVFNARLGMEDQANVELVLAGAVEVNYIESGDIAVDLDRLECPCDHKINGIGDNHLNEVFELRKSTQADIVSLWIHSKAKLDGTKDSGFGNIMGDVKSDWAPRAVHVVDWSAAVGRLSFDHELGHQFGARHNWEKDNTPNSPYIFNHGYVNLDSGQVTIMAYETTCKLYGLSCTRTGIWSDSGYPLGGPWGVATPGPFPADNARTLRSSAPTVALFHTKQDLIGCCVREGNFLFQRYRPGDCP